MAPNYGTVVIGMMLLIVTTAATGPAVAATQPAPVAQQLAPTACDYQSLHDRTIDAVVSVGAGGGLGSGFVAELPATDNATYVVTNAHVVGDASPVTVQFAGDETREAPVVGRDRLTDLAVLRVSDPPAYVDPLPVAETHPAHGQAVAALGNPFGLEETITHGIVSGLNRSMPTQFGFAIPDTVQTDAPISPGNSGGPLVTCDGTVVGVNTAGIAARGAENIGFAISPTIVAEVVPDLVEDGTFRHPYLGVSLAQVGPAEASAYGLANAGGVAVVSVQSTVPAADDLQGATDFATVDGERVPVGGDVILAVDGTSISSVEDLSSTLLTRTEVGETVELTVLRDGDVTTVTTEVTERPEPELPAGGGG